MRNRNLFNLVVAVVFLATCQAPAAIFDHFDDGLLDPAWEVTFQNATGWTYTESGTLFSVSDIAILDSNATSGKVQLWQNFLASGDFEIKSSLSWDSESLSSTMQTLGVRAYSGDTIVTQGGYADGWIDFNGEKYARIEEKPIYWYDSGAGTVPSSGSTEITLKRVSGAVSILWNDEVILTGYSDLTVDKLVLAFDKDNYPGANFGVLSVDYVSAVPEPATVLLLSLGGLALLKKRRA